MATFAKSTFSHASYAAFRPSYPQSLYNTILAYHRGPKTLCLDLGCGHGVMARELSKSFAKTIGTDPSAGMIKQAREICSQQQNETSNDDNNNNNNDDLTFRQGSAEEGSHFLPDGSVDLVVAGQAAHWFDYAKLWPEMARVVKPNGTLAYFGYKDHVFVDFPKATETMQRYAYDTHPDMLGSYWPQPGRSYVQDKLRVIRPPEGEWEDVQRVEYEPGVQGAGSGEGRMFMERETTVGEVKAYVRTWSSYHGWREAHPGRVARAEGGEGDIMDEMFERIASEEEWFGREENRVRIEWGSGLVMARRK